MHKQYLSKSRAKVIRLVHLYQSKFLEYFDKYQDTFFQNIWSLIVENRIPVGKDSERLVFAMLRYIGDCTAIGKY